MHEIICQLLDALIKSDPALPDCFIEEGIFRSMLACLNQEDVTVGSVFSICRLLRLSYCDSGQLDELYLVLSRRVKSIFNTIGDVFAQNEIVLQPKALLLLLLQVIEQYLVVMPISSPSSFDFLKIFDEVSMMHSAVILPLPDFERKI